LFEDLQEQKKTKCSEFSRTICSAMPFASSFRSCRSADIKNEHTLHSNKRITNDLVIQLLNLILRETQKLHKVSFQNQERLSFLLVAHPVKDIVS
jgi:hypothetical protein